MKSINTITLGVWVLIILNIFMSFGSIWTFNRMIPLLENLVTEEYNADGQLEHLLSGLVDPDTVPSYKLSEATRYIRELGQKELEKEKADPRIIYIADNYKNFKNFSPEVRIELARNIISLMTEHRKVMLKTDSQAQAYGTAGAWGIVFMSTFIFFVGILFARTLNKKIVIPLNELYQTLLVRKKGDIYRRCFLTDKQESFSEVRFIFDETNEMIDKV